MSDGGWGVGVGKANNGDQNANNDLRLISDNFQMVEMVPDFPFLSFVGRLFYLHLFDLMKRLLSKWAFFFKVLKYLSVYRKK